MNRVWQWHFGQAIVRTVSDFGTRSEPPTHPEMLDWMATWFMDNGWSFKKLHKLILLSSTYQQSTASNDRALREDPTNQWLWRANVQRLDFEAIRDTLLNLGGKLDRDMNGRPFVMAASTASSRYKGMVIDALQPKTSTDRRTVYAMIDRNAMPDMFGTFDFANPDMTTGERMLTTVPQQALFMMNSPFVIEARLPPPRLVCVAYDGYQHAADSRRIPGEKRADIKLARFESGRQLYIGALFSGEYALESAALFNPSIVAHPDQSGLAEGELRFIMSLRATGEGQYPVDRI